MDTLENQKNEWFMNLQQSSKKISQHPLYVPIYSFLTFKWYFDFVYNHFINLQVLKTSYHFIFKLLDKGLIEAVGPLGISSLFSRISHAFSNYQSGYVFHYGLSMFLGFSFFLLYFTIFKDYIHYNTSLSILFLFSILSLLFILHTNSSNDNQSH